MQVVHSLFVEDENVLLLFKESRNKWFLPGGKSEFGENVIETGCREFLEETGLTLSHATLGAVTTIVINEIQKQWMLYTLIGTEAKGNLVKENREGKLQFHDISTIDHLPMFEGDRFIIKSLLDKEFSKTIVTTQYYTPTYELLNLKISH